LGPGLYRHALMILADTSLAEDAVQQAFTRLLARGRVDDVASVRAFLRVVVRNEAYRLLAQRRPTEPLERAEAHLLDPVADATERLEEHVQLEQAMRQLSPEQREIVHLKVYDQLTFAQIAELLGIPLNTAASRYRYATARLRELLPELRIGA
jgi:RNA polymerase sigma-70 factor, ECF subfamily